jgi:hypothetical protein
MSTQKILGREQLKQSVAAWRRAGDSITLANGCCTSAMSATYIPPSYSADA